MSYEQWFDGADKLVEQLRANGDSEESIDEMLALCADNPELRTAFMESFTESQPSREDVARMQELGIRDYFKQTAREIAVLDLYHRYYEKGWTTKLSLDIRKKLLPSIIKTVSLAWYCALLESRKKS